MTLTQSFPYTFRGGFLNPAGRLSGIRAMMGSVSEGREQVNRRGAILAKDQEVRVCGADVGVVMQFRQAHDAGIGEVHWCVGVAFHQGAYCAYLACKRHKDKIVPLDQFQNRCPGNTILGDEMAGFGENRLTDESARREPD